MPLLVKQIRRIFSNSEANEILDLLETLESNPKKGKALSHIGNILLKELKYKKFRFYFITDGSLLKFGTTDELATLIIKFVKMSDKKDQRKVISEIKDILKTFGFDVFK